MRPQALPGHSEDGFAQGFYLPGPAGRDHAAVVRGLIDHRCYIVFQVEIRNRRAGQRDDFVPCGRREEIIELRQNVSPVRIAAELRRQLQKCFRRSH